jgi:hypothetical protein
MVDHASAFLHLQASLLAQTKELLKKLAYDVAFPPSQNRLPSCIPAKASPAALPPQAHNWGLERFATHFQCGSLIRI